MRRHECIRSGNVREVLFASRGSVEWYPLLPFAHWGVNITRPVAPSNGAVFEGGTFQSAGRCRPAWHESPSRPHFSSSPNFRWEPICKLCEARKPAMLLDLRDLAPKVFRTPHRMAGKGAVLAAIGGKRDTGARGFLVLRWRILSRPRRSDGRRRGDGPGLE